MSFSRRTRPNKSRGRRPAGQAVGVFLLFLLSFDSFFRSLLIVSRTAPFIHSSPMLFHAPEWGFALFSNSQARGRGPEPAGRGLSLLSPLALVLFPLLPPSLSHLLPLLVRARDMFLGFYRITITHHHQLNKGSSGCDTLSPKDSASSLYSPPLSPSR